MANINAILNALAMGASEQNALEKAFSTIAYAPIPLAEVFESDATNMTPITGATGPKRDMANGDTDSGIVITWVASNSDAVIFQTNIPPHVDQGDTITVKIRAKSGGTTDTPTFAADMYINEGDTKVEATSGAISSSYAELSVAISGANVPHKPRTFTCELTPGAHTTDTVVVSALWLEFS